MKSPNAYCLFASAMKIDFQVRLVAFALMINMTRGGFASRVQLLTIRRALRSILLLCAQIAGLTHQLN